MPRQFTPFNERVKPDKPYPEFPLTPHKNGTWCKKIRGRLHYFGPWEDPDGALAKYLAEKDDLHAGRKPRVEQGATTVKDAANAFLNHKQALLDAGELTPRTWGEYKEAADLLVAHMGKARLLADLGPDDFTSLRKKMAERWGPVRLGNAIQRVRSILKHAHEADLIDRPVRFGPGFDRPSAKVLRLHRAAQGEKLFTADEVRRMVAGAGVQLRAMLLVGINGGFGVADCGRLPLSALDLDAGWINFPRPKTGVGRRVPLWPETVAAIREHLAGRPTPKAENAELVFVTQQGRCWHKDNQSSPLVFKMRALLNRLGINGRKGLGFYTLRHTFRTIGDEARDQPACDFIMGHSDPSMAGHYRERISDERLKAVTEHVRAWLFPPEKQPAAAVEPKTSSVE
jgi:integrase